MLIAIPQGVWGQTITVAGVSPDGDGNFEGLSGVTFNSQTNTLTLDNVTLNHGIISNLDNLTIKFKGTNKVNIDSQSQNYSTQQEADNYAISTTVGTATLTFEKDGSGSIELYGKTTAYYTVISGFASVSYGSGSNLCYLHTSKPSQYDKTNKCLVNFYEGSSIVNATISDEISYPLWFVNSSDQGTQVVSTNVSADVINGGTVTFAPSNNTLSLNGATINGKILSALGNLTLDITGTNIIEALDSGSVVNTAVDGTLTIKKTGDKASLNLNAYDDQNSYPVIQGFTALNYEGLNLLAEIGATYGTYELWENNIYGLYNENKESGYEKRITNATFTTATLYPLWIGGTRVTSDNADDIVFVGSGTISYNDGVLTLDNVSIEDPIIISENLTINLIGNNFVSAPVSNALSTTATSNITVTVTSSVNGGLVLSAGNNNPVVGPNVDLTIDTSLSGYVIDDDTYDDKVVIEKRYNLWVNGTQVTSANNQHILRDDETYYQNKISFDGDHTLTLHNIPGTVFDTQVPFIENGIGDLTVFLDGHNDVNCGVFIAKETADGDNYTATFATDTDTPGMLTVHGNTGWYSGHTLSYSSPLLEKPAGYYDEQSAYCPTAWVATEYSDYNLKIAGTPVTSANAGGVTGSGISGTVKYNATDRILTLDGASITMNQGQPIIQCSGDLTIQLVGTMNSFYFGNEVTNTYLFKNTNESDATLTFTKSGTNASLSATYDFNEGEYIGLCDGFTTVNFNDNLAYSITSDSKMISPLRLSTPMMNTYEGKISFQTEGYLFGSKTYYKIVYANGSGNEEEVLLTNFVDGTYVDWNGYKESITINELTGPCTVYAYTKYNTETSDSAKAKLFGPASTKQTIVYGADPVELALAPAIEEGDGIMIYGIESSYINFNEDIQKATATTLGSGSFPVPLKYTAGQYTTGNTIILNSENFEMHLAIMSSASCLPFGSRRSPISAYSNPTGMVTWTWLSMMPGIMNFPPRSVTAPS